jgi:molybdopterin-guanine dinucleotide biosynthesis protein A
VLGVILAGGQNRRYGGHHKALESIGGRRILDRLSSSLSPVCDETVIVANVLEAYQGAGHDVRPDRVPGLGALGGLHTAVSWAVELDYDAALVVACDMPVAFAIERVDQCVALAGVSSSVLTITRSTS